MKVSLVASPGSAEEMSFSPENGSIRNEMDRVYCLRGQTVPGNHVFLPDVST